MWELEEVDQTFGGAPLHPALAGGASFVHMGAAEIRGAGHYLKGKFILKHVEYVSTHVFAHHGVLSFLIVLV